MTPTNSLKLEVGKKYLVANQGRVSYVKVVFISDNGLCEYPVIVEKYRTDTEEVFLGCYTIAGLSVIGRSYDITGEYHEPVTVTRYINAYKDWLGGTFNTRKEADNLASEGRTACKKITVTEGEYDD